MTIDTNELRRLAQAATPGGWYVKRGNYIYGCKEVTDGEEKWHPVIACTDDDEVNVNFEANAAFIAAANPAAISELLDRLEAAEKDIAIKEEVIDSLATVIKRLDAQCDDAEKERDDVAQQLVQSEIGKRAISEECDALRAKIAAMERQEPVYLFRRKGLDDFCTCSKERYEVLSENPQLFEVKTLYALPGAKGE